MQNLPPLRQTSAASCLRRQADYGCISLNGFRECVYCYRVKEHCIQRGLSWDDSLANTSCQEQEFYEDLLRYYRYNYRVRPGGALLCFPPTLTLLVDSCCALSLTT